MKYPSVHDPSAQHDLSTMSIGLSVTKTKAADVSPELQLLLDHTELWNLC